MKNALSDTRDISPDQEETGIWKGHGANKSVKEYNVPENCELGCC